MAKGAAMSNIPSGQASTKKILLVEDDPSIRTLIRITLGSDRYEILEVENGPSALEAVRREHPDLVLLDVGLPGGMDGFQVCRAIKSHPETSSVAVIMLTAYGQESDILKGQEAGADSYFVKPFSPLSLLQKIDEILKD
jgi:DNA-binding response OmpR family regulator